MINTKKWTDKFGSRFNIKYFILLVLATLHYEKKISDEKLIGQFQSLRRGTLQKRKGTHHCDINDRWYNDESALTVFEEIVSDKQLKGIPFVELLKHIQLFEGANYNYALNIFGSEYLYPIFNSWQPEWQGSDFYSYSDFFVPYVKVSDSSHYCYECGSKHTSIDKNETENLKTINQWLHNQKKGNLSKIPVHKVESYSSSMWSF